MLALVILLPRYLRPTRHRIDWSVAGRLLRLWMCQLCAVDLVGLYVCYRAFDGLGTEDSKPVRGLIRGVHLLLAFPQSYREHLALLCVGQEQAATETRLHP